MYKNWLNFIGNNSSLETADKESVLFENKIAINVLDLCFTSYALNRFHLLPYTVADTDG